MWRGEGKDGRKDWSFNLFLNHIFHLTFIYAAEVDSEYQLKEGKKG